MALSRKKLIANIALTEKKLYLLNERVEQHKKNLINAINPKVIATCALAAIVFIPIVRLLSRKSGKTNRVNKNTVKRHVTQAATNKITRFMEQAVHISTTAALAYVQKEFFSFLKSKNFKRQAPS